ncbi:tyrosine-type recombinase/integrase [Pseudarthrobacter sp. S9]|uniref:tyrosine-type recombinase/integrase n=1 Tax=Pseudarthrobacter sp. S9 TaxID=3418421 RepID=UPI003D0523C9
MASIQIRGPRADGSFGYQLQWRDPDTGKAERWTHDTAEAAEMWKRLLDANGQSLKQAERLAEDGKLMGPTVAELMSTHISELTDVGPYMLKRYKNAIGNHFSGPIGMRKAAAVDYEDVVRWIKYMQGKGLGSKTIANQHGFLSATMTTAVRKGFRTDNPCKGVKLPKAAATSDVIRFIDRPGWDRIMAGMDAHFVPFFQLLVGTGLRFGEATALLASDFKLDGATPTVRITKAWKEDGDGGYYIGPPKTRRSVRTVSLAPSTVNIIRATVEAAGGGYVFVLKRGGVMRSGSTYNRAWEPALKAAGIPKLERPRVHDVRHTHASWMIAAGMEIFALSRRLGHESITTTMDRYSHLLPDAHFVGANIAQKALGG